MAAKALGTVDDRVWIRIGGEEYGYGSKERRSGACPHCRGLVVRIHRRVVDRWISLLAYPVHRYRCESPRCDWKGNLRARRHARC